MTRVDYEQGQQAQVMPGRRPDPDPTELTDKAIAKAVVLLTTYVDGKVDLLAAANKAQDAAIAALVADRTRELESLDRVLVAEVKSEARVTQERFDAAERQRVEQKSDTRAAVDAALSAAKEAVKEQTTASERSIAKSEAATAKQLEQQQLTTTTALQSLRTSIDEMKERSIEDVRVLRQAINDVATMAQATVQQRVGAKEDRTTLYAGVGIVGTILGIIVTIGVVLAAQGVR